VDVEKVLAYAINFMLDKKMDMTNTEGCVFATAVY
jgi:hypothetical protein